MFKSFLVACGAVLVAAVGFIGSPVTTTAASAATPCTLVAHFPDAGGNVRAYATISCSGPNTIQVQTCLQQLVTGGWVNVVGGCQTSQRIFSTHTSATGKTYYATCGRWYRTWAWGYNNGKTGTALSAGYQGCS